MKKPNAVYEALQWASSFLEKNGREGRAADLLLKHYLGLDWTDFHLARRDMLAEEVWQRFKEQVLKHAEGVPVQHLIGYEEFYGRYFKVNEHVLIPRPETEELVAGVLEWLDGRENMTVADIGTGSGAIAVTLALEAPDCQVTAVDINEQALTVASENANTLGASVTFKKGDLLEPLLEEGKKWNVIVSNPPYIPLAEWQKLDPLVKDHEPELALVGGDDDGLCCYRKIARLLPDILKEEALAAFEIGEKQGAAAVDIFQSALPDAEVSLRRDINGKERMIFCRRKRDD